MMASSTRSELSRRTRRSHGGDNAMPTRLVQTRLIKGITRSTKLSPARHWGLLVMTAVTVVTTIFSLMPTSRTVDSSSPVGHQTIFGKSGRGAISIEGQPRRRTGRILEEDVVSKPLVDYETQLELFMCNPSLAVEGNDAYVVGEAQVAAALARISGLEQAEASEITVTIKTEPTDTDDVSYMCTTNGMLQWHAQIKYGVDAAEAAGKTPAFMAAHANDYVAYSALEFKQFLSAYVNDEYATTSDSVDLSATDIVVPTVGWIVTFPSESSMEESTLAGDSDGVVVGVVDASEMWDWWVWLIFALLVLCCLLPLCFFMCRRRREDKGAADREDIDAKRQGRNEEGLNKIYGPEWGITELDFEADYKTYEDKQMKGEYDGARKGVEPTSYRAFRPGHQSVSGEAWMQEVGRRSAWAPPSSSSTGRQGSSPSVRRLDIDDEDADDSVARLRRKHPQYSFDMNTRSGRGSLGGGGERKS